MKVKTFVIFHRLEASPRFYTHPREGDYTKAGLAEGRDHGGHCLGSVNYDYPAEITGVGLSITITHLVCVRQFNSRDFSYAFCYWVWQCGCQQKLKRAVSQGWWVETQLLGQQACFIFVCLLLLFLCFVFFPFPLLLLLFFFSLPLPSPLLSNQLLILYSIANLI